MWSAAEAFAVAEGSIGTMTGECLSRDLEAWLANPSDETQAKLMRTCQEWVEDVVQRLPPGMRAETRQATLSYLEEKVKLFDGKLFTLTDGVLTDGPPPVTGLLEPVDELELYRNTGFLWFILALTNYFSIRKATTCIDRRTAGRSLLEALRLPIANSAKRQLKNLPQAQLEVAMERVWDSLCEPSDDARGKGHQDGRLVRGWIRGEIPETFGKTVALARVAAERATLDMIQSPRNRDLTDNIVSLDREESPQPIATAWNSSGVLEDAVGGTSRKPIDQVPGLVDYLLPVCCRAASEFPTDHGAQLFPWLVLGGVSKDNREKSGTAAGHGQQPNLVKAVLSVLGANCVRNLYEPQIAGLMLRHGFLDALKACLADMYAGMGAGSADPRHSIDDGEWTFDELVGAAKRRGLLPDAIGGARIPSKEFWRLFATVGRETARQIQVGAVLKSASSPIPEQAIRGGTAGVIGWLRGLDWSRLAVGNEPLDREALAQAAKWICQRHDSVGDWENCLRSI